MSLFAIARNAAVTHNPAWAQLLGLCPLLAVSTSVANALGLAAASTFVLVGANTVISLIRNQIPRFARLPIFVLVIATFTTTAVLIMQAFYFELYQQVALFVQIIVTNCMILGRVESFASRQPVADSVADAVGTGFGFAIALVTLAAVREAVGRGTLFADMERLFGAQAAAWEIQLLPEDLTLLFIALPPGAFIVAGLLIAIAQWLISRTNTETQNQTQNLEQQKLEQNE